jgi:cell division septation protein DedD
MLRTSESETEILLGNKQLLGIFFVVVVLLGVAFAGGYKLGQASKKAAAPATVADQTPASDTTGTGGETHSVPPETPPADTTRQTETPVAQAPASTPPSGEDEPPLGSKKRARSTKAAEPRTQTVSPETSGASGFTPQTGQIFLQVAAVGRDEAEAVADVLRKKGFRAHAVPKPGSPKIFRVIVGPVRDAADLSATRDSLRSTAGFREVIVQRY